jgi:hypothetical protein
MFLGALVAMLGLLAVCVNGQFPFRRSIRNTELNALKNDINAVYGTHDGTPRVNCGPCARFAVAFRERWNARFPDKVNIACVMSADGSECGHVALKFSDGSYFDGGNGILSEHELRLLYQGCSIDEMVEFNLQLLDRRVGGLNHEYYRECPKYSDQTTTMLIEKHLKLLANVLH